MVGLIFKRSDREVRERMNDAPPRWRRTPGITGYARDPEEAERVTRESRGGDNPGSGLILCDDGGKAERDLWTRTAKARGHDPEMYLHDE